MSVSVAIKNSCSTTGEGPHWDERTQELVYVDILCGGVHRWNSVTGQDVNRHLDGTVGFVVPCKEAGRYVVGHNCDFSVLDWESGSVEVLHTIDTDRTNTRFNDGKCDPSGRLWAGTMGMETKPAVLEHHQGSLYSLDLERKMKMHVRKVDISNGLAWTADHSTMFYIDSIPRKVYAFDFDMTSGIISNRRDVIYFGGPETMADYGLPDGCSLDAEGKLWVACYNAGKIVRFDPETGKELQSISFPAKRTTSLCFGGANFDEIFVTCARAGLSEQELLNEQPLAGSVFKVTGLGIKGLPAPVYQG